MIFKYNKNINEDFDISTLADDEEDDFAFDGPDEDDEIAYIDGKFYYNDGSNKLVPVPANLQRRYLQEYENWKLEQELAENPDYNKEASIEAEKERKEHHKSSSSAANGIGKKILDSENRQAMYRGSNVENKPKHTKHNVGGTEKYVDPDLDFMEKQVGELINNMLADEYVDVRERKIKKGYAPQDHYAAEVTGPDIAMKARNRRREKTKQIKEKEIPYVLFYFDHSGSFTHQAGRWKVHKGEELRQIFLKYENGSEKDGIEPNQLKVKTFYFGNYVSSDPMEAGSGNNPNILQPHIKAEAGNHPVNVVIVSDSDINNESDTAVVQGNVWYVFFDSEAPTLKDHIFGVGKNMGRNIEYYFER